MTRSRTQSITPQPVILNTLRSRLQTWPTTLYTAPVISDTNTRHGEKICSGSNLDHFQVGVYICPPRPQRISGHGVKRGLSKSKQHRATTCTTKPTPHKCGRKSNRYFQGPLYLKACNSTPLVLVTSLVLLNTFDDHNTETPSPIAHKSKNLGV